MQHVKTYFSREQGEEENKENPRKPVATRREDGNDNSLSKCRLPEHKKEDAALEESSSGRGQP